MNARTANMIRSLEERKKLEQKKREFIKEENEKNELFKAKTREDITAYLNLDEETSVTDFLFEESLNSLQTLELQFFERLVDFYLFKYVCNLVISVHKSGFSFLIRCLCKVKI